MGRSEPEKPLPLSIVKAGAHLGPNALKPLIWVSASTVLRAIMGVFTSMQDHPMRIISLLVLATALAVSATASADKKKGTELMASWSDPSKPIISGRNVLVVFQGKDIEQRRAVETEMAKYIKGAALGVTLLPEQEMLKDSEATRFQLKRHKVDYLVVMRYEGTVPQLDYKESGIYKEQADMGSVGGMYGYWSNGWKDEYRKESITKTNKTIAQVSTKIFDVASEKLIWTSRSQTINPQNADEAVGGVVKANADAMRKAGMIK
jgi:hypothetical protein